MESLNEQALMLRHNPTRRPSQPAGGAPLALLLWLILQSLTPACRAQVAVDARQCESDASLNPDLAVQGCTALIVSGHLSGAGLAKVFVNRGVAHLNKSNYDRAIQDFEKAISLAPDTPETFNNRGLAYEQKGEIDLAIRDYESAIRLRPDYAIAFNNRGLIYAERKGDHDRAIQDLDQAIRLHPEYAEALSNRAHSHYAKGDYDLAIKDYDRAISLEPSYTGNFFDRASALSSKKEYARALADLNHALQLNSKDPSLLWARGTTHFFLGDYRAAMSDLSFALALRPEDTYCAIWLYLASARSGENTRDELKRRSAALKSGDWPGLAMGVYLGTTSATDLLASARDTDPARSRKQNCQAYFYLGEDALLRGRKTDARILFQKSIAAGSAGSFEYIGAMAELDHLNNQKRPASNNPR